MLKKVNLIYIVFIGLAYLVFQMNKNLSGASAMFYGFAENKETEINLDHPVVIDRVYVTPGQEVKRGQLLMEVKRQAVDLKIDELGFDLEKENIVARQERQQILDDIEALEAEHIKKQAFYQSQKAQIEHELALNQSLLRDLKTLNSVDASAVAQASQKRLDLLDEQLEQELAPIEVELKQLRKALGSVELPMQLGREKLSKELDFHENRRDKLKIYAPSNGLIGSVYCKKGEHIDAFSTLLNFYERNPTIVKGFVHESLILEVERGDSLKVISSLHPSHQTEGVVIGLGLRIVEIPERLRKIPEFKSYGREVLIQIPSENPFLQKEKVLLNVLTEEEKNSLVSLFVSPVKAIPVYD